MFFAWIIFGPTASGKTARAFALAQEKGADILSFDSRQLYKGMGVGTGQDIPEEYRQETDGTYRNPTDSEAPHLYGMNIVSPDQLFSISHYYEFAQKVVEGHRETGKPLVLVGGSWPYVQALIDPPKTLFAPTNPTLREQLDDMNKDQLQKRLAELNPEKLASLNNSDRNNSRRLIRAIETAEDDSLAPQPLLQPKEYALYLHPLDKVTLQKNIELRIMSRLESGVLEETKELMTQFSNWDTPAFTATGYRYLRHYLQRKITLDAAKTLWLNRELRYAKRQLTWLKKISLEKQYNITT